MGRSAAFTNFCRWDLAKCFLNDYKVLLAFPVQALSHCKFTSPWGHLRTSASLLALSSASFGVTMAQGLRAAADCMMAREKSCLEPGDSRWKATLAEPADSEKEGGWDSFSLLHERSLFIFSQSAICAAPRRREVSRRTLF